MYLHVLWGRAPVGFHYYCHCQCSPPASTRDSLTKTRGRQETITSLSSTHEKVQHAIFTTTFRTLCKQKGRVQRGGSKASHNAMLSSFSLSLSPACLCRFLLLRQLGTETMRKTILTTLSHAIDTHTYTESVRLE